MLGSCGLRDQGACGTYTKIVNKLGQPQNKDDISVDNCKEMNNVLQPLAIRFTAGLIYWFAFEIGMLPKWQSTDNIPKINPAILEYIIE